MVAVGSAGECEFADPVAHTVDKLECADCLVHGNAHLHGLVRVEPGSAVKELRLVDADNCGSLWQILNEAPHLVEISVEVEGCHCRQKIAE